MRFHSVIATILIWLPTLAQAQLSSYPPIRPGQFICVPDSQFNYPEIGLRAGLQPSYAVDFDIVGFSPSNIVINGLDSNSQNSLPLFSRSVVHNLQKLIFYRDSIGAKLTLRYSYPQTQQVSRTHAVLVAENELHIVGRHPVIMRSGPHWTVRGEPSSDTATALTFVKYESGPAPQSDILVQKFFDHRADSVVIVRNNYPQLVPAIQARVGEMLKGEFVIYAPNAKYYFARVRVQRYVTDCGCLLNY